MEAALLSADVDDRRVTEDATTAERECTRKAMEVSTRKDNSHRSTWMFVGIRKAKERRKQFSLRCSKFRDGGGGCRVRTD